MNGLFLSIILDPVALTWEFYWENLKGWSDISVWRKACEMAGTKPGRFIYTFADDSDPSP